MPKTIAVDFDGVLHGYSNGWQDGTIYDEPKPGAAVAMQRFLDLGFDVVIYSTRCYDRTVRNTFQKNQVEGMRIYLKTYNIPFTRIHTEPGKPLCVLFIDDHGYRFEGDWNKEMPAIETLVAKWIKS